ncbi:MAG: rhomboid family intramembrane serine protease [Bacteroidales bacterium]|jgi:membrane associated rhomboid family serine protease|nr:rhomboid family intramembrane serine protease [Bacteroidales bacterium]MDD3755304.1 rhomboid family intramembrane serine protease [Bacteroidales bacterium]MDY0401558.1 rhomboid family intramembrane serine protease [Bacteroidales bacterium]HHW59508.1 rhomboid family intramembrane serine protease [Bacteroidales bacterium]HOB78414.1 rhomboid family intramembrane serine protease [Bacteroidales bacterium]
MNDELFHIVNKRTFLIALLEATFIVILPIWGYILKDIPGVNEFLIGVIPRDLQHIYGIFIFPLVHNDLSHLFGNVIALYVLLLLLKNSFSPYYYRIIACGWVFPGIFIWLIGNSNTMHIGASGLVYHLAFFIFWIGVVIRHPNFIAQSLIVIFLYGGFFWGILPLFPEVSWEGHLGGFISGTLQALILYKPISMLYPKQEEEEDEDDAPPDWYEEENDNIIDFRDTKKNN